jgi:hypothetical protein
MVNCEWKSWAAARQLSLVIGSTGFQPVGMDGKAMLRLTQTRTGAEPPHLSVG